jgi:hypothetical protein
MRTSTPSRLSADPPRTVGLLVESWNGGRFVEDCQLLAESEILQGDLFIAAKDQPDHPK